MRSITDFIYEASVGAASITQIEEWCKENLVDDGRDSGYEIDPVTLTIDRGKGNCIELNNPNLTQIPSFIKFKDNIKCMLLVKDCDKLKSLKGLPRKVGKLEINQCDSLVNLEGIPEAENIIDIMWCNSLKSLKGIQKEIKNGFSISYCPQLKDFTNGPKKVGQELKLISVGIESLNGFPEIIDGICSIHECKNLETLVGCPRSIQGLLRIEDCKSLKSLEGLSDLVDFSSGLQITNCPALDVIDDLPPSLIKDPRWLKINRCGKHLTASYIRKAVSSLSTK